jgi:hypothetical protein
MPVNKRVMHQPVNKVKPGIVQKNHSYYAENQVTPAILAYLSVYFGIAVQLSCVNGNVNKCKKEKGKNGIAKLPPHAPRRIGLAQLYAPVLKSALKINPEYQERRNYNTEKYHQVNKKVRDTEIH